MVFFFLKKYQQRKKQNVKESPLFISSSENSPSDNLLKIANMSNEHHKGIDIPAIWPKGSVKMHYYITWSRMFPRAIIFNQRKKQRTYCQIKFISAVFMGTN